MGQNIDLGHGSWVMEGLSRPDETYRRSVSKCRKKNGYCGDIFTILDLEVYRSWKHSRSPRSACSYHGSS
jgi:hypothetical protein